MFSVPVVTAVVIFLVSYIFIAIDKIDKTIVALAGAGLMILVKLLSQDYAFKEAVDFNTLALLIGMMVIVIVMKKTGIFEYLAIKTVKVAKAEPIKILILLSLVTGILSALLDNVTTILLIIPVTLSIAKDLNLNPIPLIISQIFASNTGGTATLIGDPPNILIGSQVGFTFLDFINNAAVIAIPILLITTFIFVLIYKKHLYVSPELKEKIMSINELALIKDKKLLIKSLVVMGIIFVGFMFHGQLHYESGSIAFIGAILLLLISGFNAEEILHEVEWDTIFFFVGLFILVGGLKSTGVITFLAKGVINLTHGDLFLTTMAVLWVSAIASAFINNIPFVATMISLVKDMGAISGIALTPVWWALALGACLGGNGTIIGASANVIAIDMAREEGHKISFKDFFKVAFPIMILTIIITTGYIFIRYL